MRLDKRARDVSDVCYTLPVTTIALFSRVRCTAELCLSGAIELLEAVERGTAMKDRIAKWAQCLTRRGLEERKWCVTGDNGNIGG